MLSEQVSETKEKERQDPKLEVLTNYRTSLPLRDADTAMEHLVQEAPRQIQSQMMKGIGSEENFDNQTCRGMDVEESGKLPRILAASSQQTLSGGLIETLN